MEDDAFKNLIILRTNMKVLYRYLSTKLLVFMISELVANNEHDDEALKNIFINKTKILTNDEEFLEVLRSRTRPIDRMKYMFSIGARVFAWKFAQL